MTISLTDEQIKACSRYEAPNALHNGGWVLCLDKVRERHGPGAADALRDKARAENRRRYEAELRGTPPRAKRKPPTPIRPRSRTNRRETGSRAPVRTARRNKCHGRSSSEPDGPRSRRGNSPKGRAVR
jgi:hypothetical protein